MANAVLYTDMSYVQLIKSEPRPLLFGLSNAFFSGLGQTHFVALFSPFLIALFGVSNTQYGLMYSIATLLSALVLPFAGVYIDRMDIRKFAMLVGLGLIVSELILLSTSWLPLVFVALFGLRLFGQGLCSHITVVPTARYFNEVRGKALGIVIIGQPLAEGVLTPIAAYGLEFIKWQNMCLIMAIFVAVVYLPLMLTLTKGNDNFNKPNDQETTTKKDAQVSGKKSWTRRQVFTHPTAYFLIPQSLMPAFTLTGVLFHQGLIGEMKGWSLVQIASGLTFFAIGRSIMGPLSGPFVDRVTAYRLYPYYLIPLILGFVILAYTPNIIFAYISFALFGMSVGMGGTIKSAIWPELYGTAHLGAINSTLGTIVVFSTAVSPGLFGYILDYQQEPVTLILGCGVITGITSLLAWFHLRFGAATSLRPEPPRT